VVRRVPEAGRGRARAQLVANVSSSSSLYLANPNLLVETVTFGNSTTPYLRLSGTSMAAAVTTGVVAQMLDASFRTLNGGWGRNGAKVAPTLPRERGEGHSAVHSPADARL